MYSPPLKNHPSKPIGFVYSPLWKIIHQNPSVSCTPPLWKITFFGGRLSRGGRLFRQIRYTWFYRTGQPCWRTPPLWVREHEYPGQRPPSCRRPGRLSRCALRQLRVDSAAVCRSLAAAKKCVNKAAVKVVQISRHDNDLSVKMFAFGVTYAPRIAADILRRLWGRIWWRIRRTGSPCRGTCALEISRRPVWDRRSRRNSRRGSDPPDN